MNKRNLTVASLLLLFCAPLLSAQSGFATHSSEKYMLDFSYPSRWHVTEHENTLVILSSRELEAKLDAEFPRLESGELVVTVSAIPALMFTFMGIEEGSVQEQLNGFFDMMLQEAVGSAEAVDRGSTEASSGVTVSSISFDSTEEVQGEAREFSGTFLGVADEQKGVVTFAFAIARRPTLDRQQEALVETVGSMVYTGSLEEMMGGN